MAIKKFLIPINSCYLRKLFRVWNKLEECGITKYHNNLVSIGFKKKKYKTNKCLFRKYNKNNNKLTYLLTLYVDYILLAGIYKYLIYIYKNK